MGEQKGQTLLEILLAFSVSIAVLSAIVIGVVTALSNAEFTRNQNQANAFAQEGMTVVKQIRDSSWAEFKLKTDSCLDKDSNALEDPPGSGCGSNVGIFKREVKFEHNSLSCCSKDPVAERVFCENELKGSKTTTIVSWSDSKCPSGSPYCHKVEISTCLADINKKPTL